MTTTDLTPGPREARVRTVGFLPGDEVMAAQTDPGDGTESGVIVTRADRSPTTPTRRPTGSRRPGRSNGAREWLRGSRGAA